MLRVYLKFAMNCLEKENNSMFTANDFDLSYPAMFNNVIGVRDLL